MSKKTWRDKAVGAALAGLTVGASMLPLPVKAADHYFMLQNRYTNRCLDVYDWDRADNARMTQYWCHGGTNQRWKMSEPTAAGVTKSMIINQNSSKCLRSDGQNGAPRQGGCTNITPEAAIGFFFFAPIGAAIWHESTLAESWNYQLENLYSPWFMPYSLAQKDQVKRCLEPQGVEDNVNVLMVPCSPGDHRHMWRILW